MRTVVYTMILVILLAGAGGRVVEISDAVVVVRVPSDNIGNIERVDVASGI